MNSSISFIILMINKKLFIDLGQKRILFQLLKDSDNEVPFIMFYGKNEASVAIYVIVFRILDS